MKREITINDLDEIVELNMWSLETLKDSVDLLVGYSEKNGIPLPSNARYLITEASRIYRNIISNDSQNPKKFMELNLQFLETIKELTSTLITYSEKNSIYLSPQIYQFVAEANKTLQSISDEILQVNENDKNDRDYTEPG